MRTKRDYSWVLISKTALLIFTVTFLLVSMLDAPFPREQILQHIPTVLSLAALAYEVKRSWLTLRSFSCVVALLWLHILGARYIYSFVPYDELSQLLFGSPISELAGWRRNHYDRLVHFLFGILWMIPVHELAIKRGHLTPKWAQLFAFMAVVSTSALYEVFEWGLTVVMSPQDADSYNGQQGDIWDPQKDMALAGIGAVLSMIGLHRSGK